MQLKGAGRMPFCWGADGRAVLHVEEQYLGASVGFAKGNFNADDCLVVGIHTMDYEPFGFMDEFPPSLRNGRAVVIRLSL
eukprot:scaffold421367_cov62-Attheya_sp.AAC.1